MSTSSTSTVPKAHIGKRLSAAALTVGVLLVLAAGAAFARVRPTDPSAEVLIGERDLGGRLAASNPLVITESVSWTRYALIAAIACLVGVLATLTVEFVARRRRHMAVAHA
jgi:hypothetical protein